MVHPTTPQTTDATAPPPISDAPMIMPATIEKKMNQQGQQLYNSEFKPIAPDSTPSPSAADPIFSELDFAKHPQLLSGIQEIQVTDDAPPAPSHAPHGGQISSDAPKMAAQAPASSTPSQQVSVPSPTSCLIPLLQPVDSQIGKEHTPMEIRGVHSDSSPLPLESVASPCIDGISSEPGALQPLIPKIHGIQGTIDEPLSQEQNLGTHMLPNLPDVRNMGAKAPTSSTRLQHASLASPQLMASEPSPLQAVISPVSDTQEQMPSKMPDVSARITVTPDSSPLLPALAASPSADHMFSNPDIAQPIISQIQGIQVANDESQSQAGQRLSELPYSPNIATDVPASSTPIIEPAASSKPNMATEASSCWVPLQQASLPSPSSGPMALHPGSIQVVIPHAEGAQVGNDGIQIEMLHPSPSAAGLAKPKPQQPSILPDMQPSAQLESASLKESRAAIEDCQHRFTSIDHTRRPDQCSDLQGSQIYTSRMQPNEQNYQPRPYGGQYPGQAYGSISEANLMPRPYGSPYQGQEFGLMNEGLNNIPHPYNGLYQEQEQYNVPQPRSSPNQRQRYYSDIDTSDIMPWPSNNGDLEDTNQPLGALDREQMYQPRIDESGDAFGPYRGRYRGQEGWLGSNNLDSWSQSNSGRYQQQGRWPEKEYMDEVPCPYERLSQRPNYWLQDGSLPDMPRRYQRPVYWPQDGSLPDMPRPYERQYQRPAYWPQDVSFRVMPQPYGSCYPPQMSWPGSNASDDRPLPPRSQGEGEFPGNSDFAGLQETRNGRYRRGMVDFANDDIPREQCAREQRSPCQFDGVQQAESGWHNEDLNNIAQRVVQNSTTHDGAEPNGDGRESGPLVCDNIIIGDASKVVIGEGNRAGGICGGRVTGNRVMR